MGRQAARETAPRGEMGPRMQDWSTLFNALGLALSAYITLVWASALLDLGKHPDAVWQASGRSKPTWLIALFAFNVPAAFLYWSRARPDLDRQTPEGSRVAIPWVAQRRRWEVRLGEWDHAMRQRPWWLRLAVAAVAATTLVLLMSAAAVWSR